MINFRYHIHFKDLIKTVAEHITYYQKKRFKTNYSSVFVLKSIETKELRYYHSSYNDVQKIKTDLLISDYKLLNFFNFQAEKSIYDG